MKIGKTKLLPENIAPSNASSLAIFNGDTKVCDIDISKMQPTNLGSKMYSFGLLSDIHLNSTDGYVNSTRFDNALTYFENQGAEFACVSGDLTNIGFWSEQNETEIYLNQFGEYKRIRDLHPNLSVYGICGNHENYNKNITENLTELEQYMGYGLTYTINKGNDVFVFVGQSTGTLPMADTSLQWLYETLEANRNKRCFVFIHPYVSAEDSGNPFGLHATPLFSYWGTTKTTAFKSLMSHYKNTILFHGHSHIHFDLQKQVKNSNYSTVFGFRSVHIPSTAYCRFVTDGELIGDTNECLGYFAEVYSNHIILKGYDFTRSQENLIAQYCIDTTLQTIAPNTYTDSTGTITT